MKKISSDPPEATINLADLRDSVLADQSLQAPHRTKLATAIATVADLVGQPLEAIPAHPPLLRDLLADIMPKRIGLSEGRFRTIPADLQNAMMHAGIVKVPGRSLQDLSPAWADAIKPLPKEGDRFKLSRLGRYCTAQGIGPEVVNDDVMNQFLVDVRDHSLVAGSVRAHRDAITAWNRLAAKNPDWPQRQLKVPNNTNTYALPWKDLPAALKADVDAWLKRLAGDDPDTDDDFNPLKPRSLQLRAKQVHEFVSALVLRGQDPTLLASLAGVVVPERVADGLAFFAKRAGKRKSVHASQIAGVICSIAKHWVKVSKEDLDRLNAMKRKATPRTGGMTSRNRTRLRPLQDRATQKKLIDLPYIIADEVVDAGVPSRTLALQMETAIALALLFVSLIRIRNLVDLKIGQNLVPDRKGGVTLVLEEFEVKNEVAKETRLPSKTVRMLDLYVRLYRPLLGKAATPWLFPGKTGLKPKAVDPIRRRIQKCVRARLGLDFHPHLTRHANALMVLQRNPGAYAMVQRLIGHKSLNSTVNYYTGLETNSQVAYFLTEVLGFDNEAPQLAIDKRRRKKPVKQVGRKARP